MYDPLPDAAAKAVTSWIANNAAKSDKYKINGHSVTFHATKSYGIFGICSTVIAIGCAFIPDLAAKLVLMAIFGVLGVLILLYGFVMRLTLDPERIIYRGPFGLKKQILWRDVQSVSVIAPEYGDLMINSRDARIRVFAYLAGFNDIKQLLTSRFPASFDAEAAVEAGSSHLLQKEFGSNVFKPKKLSTVVGFSLIILALSGVLYSLFVYPQTDIAFFVGIPVYVIAGVLMIMYGCLTRVYIRDDRLVYRTLFLREKMIRWEDIISAAVLGEPKHELIEIRSGSTRIRVRIDLKGYPLIKALILKRCPESASVSVESLSPLKPL